MGACTQGKAPISYLLRPPPPPSAPPSRRLFLFALPICSCTTLALTIACNGNAKASTGLRENPFTGLAESYDPGSTVSQTQKEASGLTSRRVSEALDLLEKGREFQALGNFNEALLYFTKVVESYKDFAFSEYARVGRALALYEVGDREEAIAEMEDVSISLKGYPEVHAALAAALYVDKHAPLLAENQFAIATLLDPHYTDLSYVKEIKHWPPSLVCSLQHFITLS